MQRGSIGLLVLSLSISPIVTVDVTEAALCRVPNGQIVNVPRPCRTDRFEIPVQPSPPTPMQYPAQVQNPAQMPQVPMPSQQYPMPTTPMPQGPIPSQVTGYPPPQQPSSVCIIPNLGNCPWMGALIGSQCSCSDGMNNYVGFAQ
jgi:hypothetical protein